MSTKDNELLALKVFLVLIGISAFGYFLGGWAILIFFIVFIISVTAGHLVPADFQLFII